MLALRSCNKLFTRQIAQLSTRASSTPIVNKVAQNLAPSTVCLVEHPHVLDGYKAPDVQQIQKQLFAVVDFSGTQYKVLDVRKF